MTRRDDTLVMHNAINRIAIASHYLYNNIDCCIQTIYGYDYGRGYEIKHPLSRFLVSFKYIILRSQVSHKSSYYTTIFVNLFICIISYHYIQFL